MHALKHCSVGRPFVSTEAALTSEKDEKGGGCASPLFLLCSHTGACLWIPPHPPPHQDSGLGHRALIPRTIICDDKHEVEMAGGRWLSYETYSTWESFEKPENRPIC